MEQLPWLGTNYSTAEQHEESQVNTEHTPPLHRMLYTDIRTLEVSTYQVQHMVRNRDSAIEIGSSIAEQVRGLHEVLPRDFQVVLFFRTNAFALDVVEALREHWEDMRAIGFNLPSFKVTIARNYIERTDHVHLDFNEPSQQEV